MTKDKKEAIKFLVKNLLQGLAWFMVLLLLFVLASNYLPEDIKVWLTPLKDQQALVYSIFFFSETVFGIIPPEIFMVWALGNGIIYYIEVILLLTILSYIGGIVAYYAGRLLANTKMLKKIKQREGMQQYFNYYKKFGGILIFIAAVTPVPFALVSMISGSLEFPFKSYLKYAVFRVLRFAVYGYFIWEGMQIQF